MHVQARNYTLKSSKDAGGEKKKEKKMQNHLDFICRDSSLYF